VLKECQKGTVATITKVASQKGSKLVTSYNVEVDSKVDTVGDVVDTARHNQTNPYLNLMIKSFEDALVIQEKFNGMANVNQLSITMFIQRCKEIELKK